MTYVWIALGSALGGVGRYWCSTLVDAHAGASFPWGTLVVNVSGCFLIGVLAAWTEPDGRWYLSPAARQFLMIGVLGGYTTFSSFSLQTLALARNGEWLQAGGNILLSVLLCMIGVWLGLLAATALNRGPA